MLLLKTLRARDALHEHARDAVHLTTRQRQILIMCDGKRSSDALVDLMGAEAADDIALLLRERYLVPADAAKENNDFAPTAAGEMWDVSEFNDEIDLPSSFRES